jgi:flagellar hook-associated protein 1 FlgK
MFIGLSGLQAQQSALNVVGNNIANVNTPGYTREVANLTSNQSLMQGQAYFGTGVSLNDVTSVRDKFLDLQIAQATSAQSGATALYTGVGAISTSLGDTTSTGLAAQIQAFFQGFQALAANPESSAARTSVVSGAQSMINSLQVNYQLLQQQQNSANQTVGSLVTQVNTLTSQIAQLNQQIIGSGAQGSNSSAVDQRTALTNQLAQLVGINVLDGGNGQYQITLDSGAATLVSGNSSFNLQTMPGGPDNFSQVNSVMNGTTVDVTSSIKSGQLGAQLQLRDTTYAGYESQLDALAAGISSQVNLLNRSGYAAGAVAPTGTDFFQGAAANGLNGLPTTLTSTVTNPYKGMVDSLSVNGAIIANLSLIAAAGPPVPPATAAAGDNLNANNIANLQFSLTGSSSAPSNVTGVVLGSSYSDAVGTLVGTVGSDSQRYQLQSTTQQNLVSALQTQRDQLSGVSLDEEAAHLMTLQSGYQAAARFLNVINQLTAGLITQFGG